MQIEIPQLVHGKVSKNSVEGLQKFRDEKYLDKDSIASTKNQARALQRGMLGTN